MKLIRQSTLNLSRGSSEKVYEIDLCEVGEAEFVVNFRYGKRGRALQDGSMTPLPVPLREAEQIFNKLRRSRIDKGYVDPNDPQTSNPVAAAPTKSSSGPRAYSPSARNQRILERLAEGDQPGASWPLDRVILRAGELQLKQAEPEILNVLATAKRDELRRHNCAWALGRCGSAASVPALRELLKDRRNQPSTRRIAGEALRMLLAPPKRDLFIQQQREQLPRELARLAESGPAADFTRELAQLIARDAKAGYTALYRAYLIEGPHTREAVLELSRSVVGDRHGYAAQRILYKAAEYRGDGQLFGQLLACLVRQPGYTCSEYTRNYFDRRAWRVLQRIAARDLETLNENPDTDEPPEQFVRMAVGVLTQPEPDDLSAGGQLLYQKNAQAHAPLWQSSPRALVHLIDESDNWAIHRFAVEALRKNSDFLDKAGLPLIMMLLGRPSPVTHELALELARARYDAAHPDLALLLALALSVADTARQQGHAWLDRHRQLVQNDATALCSLAICEHADTRSFVSQLLRSTPLSSTTAQALLVRLVAHLLDEQTNDSSVVNDVAELILRQLDRHISTIGVDILRDLAQHPKERVQALAGELLAAHDQLARRVPNDLLLTLLRAPTPTVRATGMHLVGLMPRHDLSQRPELLFNLCTSTHSDLRHAAQPLVRACAVGHNQFAADLGRLLCERLRFSADQAIHSFVLELLQQELSNFLRTLDQPDVLKLLNSRFAHAQQLGSQLLTTQVDARRLSIAELLRLASHEMREVRSQAWAMIERNQARLEQALQKSTALLDAPWRDTRAFAMAFFRDRVHNERLTVPVLVGICDSTRPDIQQFGRELITRSFEGRDGQDYLLALSEHPSEAMQLFATHYLERYACDNLERLRALIPYFRAVLCRVNRGAIAKLRVFKFMEAEALKTEAAAELLAPVLADVSVTMAVQNKAKCIESMLKIARAYPAVALPLKLRAHGDAEASHAL